MIVDFYVCMVKRTVTDVCFVNKIVPSCRNSFK